MATCTRCGIFREDLPENYVCGDCVALLRPTQKAKDFVEWLRRERPEVYERAMVNNVSDDEVVQ